MINNLQTLRGLAALMIFAHHFGFRSAVTESFGDCAVAIFMMLSGFVLTLGFLRPTATPRQPLSKFMLKRIIRVYPLYFLGQISMFVLLGFHIAPSKALADLLLLQSWIPDADYYFSGNSPSWFVSDLLLCYALFLPTLRLFISNCRASVALLSVILIAYFALILLLPDPLIHPIVYIFPPMQFPVFCLGILCALLYRKSAGATYSKKADILILSAFGLLILQIIAYPHVSPRFSLSSYWWMAAFALIYLLAAYDKTRCAVSRLLHAPALIKFGDISFAFYIFHLPYLTFWRRFLHHFEINLPIAADFIISTAALTVICIAIHRFIEIPSTKYFDRRLLSSLQQ